MLNVLWIGLILVACVSALAQTLSGAAPDAAAVLGKALFESAQGAVTLLIGLAGPLIFWMGLLAVAEDAGAVRGLARLLGPLLRRVFPGLPPGHPAAGAIVLNFAANALGLDNAATPAGLRAMRELQTLNPRPDTASDAQVMFIVLHAASLSLIPVGVMSVRAAAGAANPADVFVPLLLTSAAGALGGFLLTAALQRQRLRDPLLLAWLGGAVLLAGALLMLMGRLPADVAQTVSTRLGSSALLLMLVWILGLAAWRRVDAWAAFLRGAREGGETVVAILPNLVGMLVAIGLFRASGALDVLASLLQPLLHLLGLPAAANDALPVMLAKPLSGSAARALLVDVLQRDGADSWAGRLASLFQGGTDTTFYVIALYSGAAGLRRLRHALPCALFADLCGFAAALVLARVFFGG